MDELNNNSSEDHATDFRFPPSETKPYREAKIKAERLGRALETATIEDGIDFKRMAHAGIISEIEGMLLGLRNGVITFTLKRDLDEYPNIVDAVKNIDENLLVAGNFIIHVPALREYIATHPKLVFDAGLDPDSDLVRIMYDLSQRVRESEELSEKEDMINGIFLGFPESAIRGFAKQRQLLKAYSAPSPQLFKYYQYEILNDEKWKHINLDAEDRAILEKNKEIYENMRKERLLKPESERPFLAAKDTAEISESTNPHLEKWYKKYFGMPELDARFLATQHPVRIYLEGEKIPCMNFGSYGIIEASDVTEIKEEAKNIKTNGN